MAAGITLAILVLPIVIITSAEAIRAVPSTLREAGYGVGATRWEVTRTQVLPYAAAGHHHRHGAGAGPGARRGGAADPRAVPSPGCFPASRALLDASPAAGPVHRAAHRDHRLGADAAATGFDEIAAAAIIVMLVIVLAMNTVAIVLRNRFEKKRT